MRYCENQFFVIIFAAFENSTGFEGFSLVQMQIVRVRVPTWSANPATTGEWFADNHVWQQVPDLQKITVQYLYYLYVHVKINRLLLEQRVMKKLKKTQFRPTAPTWLEKKISEVLHAFSHVETKQNGKMKLPMWSKLAHETKRFVAYLLAILLKLLAIILPILFFCDWEYGDSWSASGDNFRREIFKRSPSYDWTFLNIFMAFILRGCMFEDKSLCACCRCCERSIMICFIMFPMTTLIDRTFSQFIMVCNRIRFSIFERKASSFFEPTYQYVRYIIRNHKWSENHYGLPRWKVEFTKSLKQKYSFVRYRTIQYPTLASV